MCLVVKINGYPDPLDVDEKTMPFIDTSSIDLYRSSYNDEILYNVSFPKTGKNYLALNGLLDASGIDLSPKEIDVLIINNTDISPIDKMRPIRNGFHSDGRFYVVFYNSKSWAKLAKAKKLKDVDYGESGLIVQDTNSIAINHAVGGKAYTDGGRIWRFPLELNHDDVTDKWYLDINERRPLVYLTAVLKKTFASIGYYFDCPFLESEAGRRILVYILDDKYNDYFPKTTMETTSVVDDDVPGTLVRPLAPRNTTVVDGKWVFLMNPNGDFDGNTYRNHGIVESSFLFKFKVVKLPGFVSDITWRFELCSGDEVVAETDVTWNLNSEDEHTVELFAEHYVSPNRKPLQVRYYILKDGVKKVATSDGSPLGAVTPLEISFKVVPKKAYIKEGMSYNVEKLFQGSDTLWDITIGFAEAIFGMVTVDYNKMKISIHSPFDAYYHGTKIDGYYTQINRVVERIKEFGSNIESDQRELSRYIELGFKASNDINIPKGEEKEGFQKSGFFGSFIDFGEKYRSDREPFINTYFEPTITKEFPVGQWYTVGMVFDILNQRQFKSTRFPMIVGEENYKQNNVGRRILFSYGFDDLQYKRDAGILPSTFYKVPYRDGILYKAYWASQDFLEDIHTYNALLKPLNLNFVKIQEAQTPSLFSMIAKNAIKGLRNSVTGTVETYMNPDDYNKLDRRATYTYIYRDHIVQGYVIGISAYTPCVKDNDVAIDIRVSNPFLADPTVVTEVETRSFADHGFDFFITKDGCTYTANEYPTSSF